MKTDSLDYKIEYYYELMQSIYQQMNVALIRCQTDEYVKLLIKYTEAVEIYSALTRSHTTTECSPAIVDQVQNDCDFLRNLQNREIIYSKYSGLVEIQTN